MMMNMPTARQGLGRDGAQCVVQHTSCINVCTCVRTPLTGSASCVPIRAVHKRQTGVPARPIPPSHTPIMANRTRESVAIIMERPTDVHVTQTAVRASVMLHICNHNIIIISSSGSAAITPTSGSQTQPLMHVRWPAPPVPSPPRSASAT